MEIQMLETRRGTCDGFTVQRFHSGCVYTVGETIGHTLAARFINLGWAGDLSEKAA